MTTPQGAPRPKEIHTRFLYPFFFERSHPGRAQEKLCAATLTARDGQQVSMWECAAPPALYREELLEHVEKYLFGETERGCRYLRLSGAAGSRWFNKAQVVISEAGAKAARDGGDEKPATVAWPVALSPLAGVEVFLTGYGVGVLSISLTLRLNELDYESAMLFNYKLSQLRPQVAPRLRIPHPSENEEAWAHIPAAQREKMQSPPPADAPLSERLGAAGGSFLLGELIPQTLLGPLADLGFAPAQHQLSVYTVVRFGDEVDFDEARTVKALGAFLSGISQVEEPSHAGAPTGVMGVTNAILNRHHWSAVGLLGMAHIISDQPVHGLGFNEQRVPRILLKYFVPYLAALLQRASLHRSIGEASNLVLSRSQNTASALADLRWHMLEFAVECYFPEISSREVIDRYYRMVREGLGVRRAFDDAHRAIAGMDAQHTSERQEKLSMAMAENVAATKSLQEKMAEHLRVVASVQSTVEWIEIFFVSVYLAHLWEMFAEHVPELHYWIPHGIIGAAVIGALTSALLIFKPWRRGRHGKH
ncbi:MAG: hypothetical protein M3444_02995 [Acidobacteriota bacterium]|nr:hypothetical protein [Acidobacteriota bacterium]MDQ5835239.1 hypothetical protein [Acidobacteriota bacterium]